MPSSVRKQCKPTALKLQQQRESLVKETETAFRARSGVVTSNPLKVTVAENSAASNADHLYASVETITSSNTTPEAVKTSGDQCHKPPPLYHVLEGPTPTEPRSGALGEKRDSPCVPPKPPRSRPRIVSSISLDDRGTEPNGLRSVDRQLSSVMAIYEEVPDRGRSKTALLLPLGPVKGAANDNKTPNTDNKQHIYHVLEEPCTGGHNNTSESPAAKIAAMVNNANAFHRENAEESAVCKTQQASFHSEVPKIPQRMPTEIAKENMCTKLDFSKKMTTDKGPTRVYTEPCTRRDTTPQCHLFDDSTYCTHSCSGSDKLASSTDSAIASPQFDDPCYATPSMRSKQGRNLSRSSDGLFDDPTYSSSEFKADRSTAGRVRVTLAGSKPRPMHGRNVLHRRVLEQERKGVRHSSSVEHFGHPSVNSNATSSSSVNKFKGNSMTDLSLQATGVRKNTVTDL